MTEQASFHQGLTTIAVTVRGFDKSGGSSSGGRVVLPPVVGMGKSAASANVSELRDRGSRRAENFSSPGDLSRLHTGAMRHARSECGGPLPALDVRTRLSRLHLAGGVSSVWLRMKQDMVTTWQERSSCHQCRKSESFESTRASRPA
jgi:hypothetical protein